MVQGDFVMVLVRMLQKGYGIPLEYITYVAPKRKKNRNSNK